MSSLATTVSAEFIHTAFNSLQRLTSGDEDHVQTEQSLLWLKQQLDTLFALPVYILTSKPKADIAHAFSPVITIREHSGDGDIVKSDHLILASPYAPNDEKLHHIKAKNQCYQQVSFLFLITQLFNAVSSQLDNIAILLETPAQDDSEPTSIMLRAADIQKLSQEFFEIEAAAKPDVSKQLWSKIATKKIRETLYGIGLQHEQIKTIQCWAFGALCHVVVNAPKSKVSAIEISIKNQLKLVIDQAKITITVQHISEVQSDAMAQYMLEKTNSTMYDHLWHHFLLLRWFKNTRNMAALVFEVQQQNQTDLKS